jgi:hypothetical protein
LFLGVNVVVTSLIHAYRILPYNIILLTSAVNSYSLTFTLDIPNILQFVHTALKLRLADLSLAYNILTGVVTSFAIMIPRYLN